MNIKIKKIVRSGRKTISLQVCDDISLVIRAPLKIKNSEIEKIIKKHSKWLKKKINEINARDIGFTQKKFIEGEYFLYLGIAYPLKMISAKTQKYPLTFHKGAFYLSENVIDVREALLAWYKKEAKKLFSQAVRFYAQKIGLNYNKIKISNARKQWGSCTGLNNLYFSWRLVMAPPSVINYVAVHELVHVIEKNHSQKFWTKVQSILPDYNLQKDWLKKNGYLLTI